MGVWRKIGNSPKYGVVIYHFKLKGNTILPLVVGDTVVIREETDDWYMGYATKNKSQVGIFPKNYVYLKEATIVHSGSIETIIPKEPPIAQEITSVVREWFLYWKTQYVDDDTDFSSVQDMIHDLLQWRKEITSRKITTEQLKDLKQKVSAKIDLGNALLGLDLVVRDDEGNILNPESASVVRIYREHVDVADRLKREMQGDKDAPVEYKASVGTTYNLYVMLHNFVCRVDDAEIIINVYDGKDMKYICENYIVKWDKERLQKDPDFLGSVRVVFTDLDAKDRQLEKVFLVFQIVRCGVMDYKDVDDRKQTRGLRRPFGAAAMDITEILQGAISNTSMSDEQEEFIPFLQCGDKEFMDSCVRKTVTGKEINHRGQGLFVSLKLLKGDIKQIREDFPHLVQPSTTVVRKMGFPDVILPGDVRNDIYVTILEGEFNRGSKTADKNVEVVMLVCNKQGEVLKGVINPGCGSDGHSDYRTLIYYHEDKPKWLEVVKVAVSTESEFRGLHLKFLFKHKSRSETKDKNEKPFAMAFVKLLNKNGTTLRDEEHDLLLYKIDNKKEDKMHQAYLDLPSTLKELEASNIAGSGHYGPSGTGTHSRLPKIPLYCGPYSLSYKDSFKISTYVCSTKLTHNVDLLGLLRWQEVMNDQTLLKKHLEHLMRVDGEEIVKGLIANSMDPDETGRIRRLIWIHAGRKRTSSGGSVTGVDLLGCLKWQKILNENDTASLKKHLTQLMRVDGEEIVKFLQDLLDSLFYILMQNTVSDLYDNLVFDALVYIIGLVADSRYYQFRPILDAYINSFSITTAYNKLMSILKEYVDNANEDTEHEPSFRMAMKSLEYIFKFIIRSRELFALLNENRGKQQFEIMLKQLIQSIGGMMLYTSDRTVRAQGYALRNMPATISDILKVFNAVELSQLFVEFLNHVPKSRLKIQKIKCVEDLVETELFAKRECREVLLPMMLCHIRDLMEAQDEMSACIKVLSSIMDKLFTPSKPLCHDRDVSMIMEIILRTVIQTTIKTHAGDCVAVLLNILRQMTESHYVSYITRYSLLTDLEDFLMEIIMLFQNLITSSVFQHDWMEMIMLQNSIILRSLRCFAHTISDKFSNPFQYQLWNNFFHCAISFLTQDHLQLENFSSSKRNKIISSYKDMRREMGFEIRSMWKGLGQNKISFIPEMVGPLLEMTLIPETELRKATIPIFFDMMVCEFNQPTNKGIKGNFKEVENEMINQMDVLVEGGRGDEQYMQLFKDTLLNLCNGSEQIRKQGLEFVETVTKLLQRLLEYRHIIQDEIKDHRMSCIVNLLDFYNEIGRQEMYVRYLHKLHNMHLDFDNFTEAAHTLILYAKLLSWSDERLSTILHSERFPEAVTHRELKEMLYHHIIQYFEKGKMWEKGIDLCKEISVLYENDLFDYEKLSWILRRQAALFESIMKEMRPDPEYFRVGYYGRGFPSFLQGLIANSMDPDETGSMLVANGLGTFSRGANQILKLSKQEMKQHYENMHTRVNVKNKVFIYRGKEYERLQDFNGRMQTLFPNGELMKTLSAPSEELQESPKQYLQINAVTPVMEMHQKFLNKQVSEKILKYYQMNEVQLFTFSRRIDEGGSNIANIWQEKTNMTTSSPLPGILCWFPVTQTIVYKVSPIETAIETLESSNKKLSSAIEHQLTEPKARLDQLGMLLKGIVDAAVMGGIANWKHFYDDEFAQNDKDKEFAKQLKEHTKSQAVLIKDGMWVHRRKCPDVQKAFHAYLEEKHIEWLQMIETEYNIKVMDKVSGTSTLKRFQSMSQSVLSLDRLSSMYQPNAGQGAVGGSLTNVSSSPSITVTPSPGKPPGIRTQSVWVKADKGDKSTPTKGLATKVNKKLGNKRASQVSTTSSSDSPDSNRNSLDNPIELNEQITPKRPPRPEVDKERRNSQRLSAQFAHMGHLAGASPGMINKPNATASFISYTSTENGDSDNEEGAPPPLPEKHAGDNRASFDAPPVPNRTSITPAKTPRRSKPSVKPSNSVELGSTPLDSAPPLLPEKLTPSRSFDGETL